MTLFPLLAGYDMEPQMLLAMNFLNRQLEDNLVNLDEIARKIKLMKTIENYEKMVKLGKTENLDLMEFKHALVLFHFLLSNHFFLFCIIAGFHFLQNRKQRHLNVQDKNLDQSDSPKKSRNGRPRSIIITDKKTDFRLK